MTLVSDLCRTAHGIPSPNRVKPRPSAMLPSGNLPDSDRTYVRLGTPTGGGGSAVIYV